LKSALNRQASTNSVSVAVVGAGLAGIACARRLREAGMHVSVFESQRSPGGRLATRRFAAASFDHGAQYLTATDTKFRSVLESAQFAGAAAHWRPDWQDGDRGRELWVGYPAMNSLPRFFAQELDVEYGARILRLERDRGGWALMDDRGSAHTDFSAVVLAVPAPVAAALAGVRTALATRVKLVSMAPCWATLVAFESPLDGVPDAAFPGDPMLGWFARNGSKPGRDARDSWVLHASAGWSRIESDQPARNVQGALLDRFSERVGRPLPRALVSDGHRWRHARVETPLGEPFLLDLEVGIGFCGDWCLDAHAEAAWLSGDALGAALSEARHAIGSGKMRGSR
jgi:predicted NAD/FAD-dependent oxidoreductase